MDESLTSYEFSQEAIIDDELQNFTILNKLVRNAEEQLMLSEKKVDIPACVLRRDMGSLQSIVKYLKENQDLSFSRIASLLSRDPRTIWAEYSAVKKLPKMSNAQIRAESLFISTEDIKARKFSVLESIALVLKKRGMKNVQIADVLGKSPKTIWTVLDRASKKSQRFGKK